MCKIGDRKLTSGELCSDLCRESDHDTNHVKELNNACSQSARLIVECLQPTTDGLIYNRLKVSSQLTYKLVTFQPLADNGVADHFDNEH